FGPITAVDSISLTLEPGQVHAIVGENGAGKSTLVNILSGALEPDQGSVVVDGVPSRFRSPADALRTGVGTIYQERALVPHLTIAENIVLGHEPMRGKLIHGRSAERQAGHFLSQVGLSVNTHLRINSLLPARKRMGSV